VPGPRGVLNKKTMKRYVTRTQKGKGQSGRHTDLSLAKKNHKYAEKQESTEKYMISH